MRPRDGTIPLPLAVLLAILLHIAGFAILAPGIADGARSTHVRGELAPDEIGPPQSPATEEITLGIDAETPSSLTWIGYDQYEEHLARLSEVDQAAFDDDPSAGAGGVIDGQAPEPVQPGSSPTSQPETPETTPTMPTAPTTPPEEMPNQPTTPAPTATPVEAAQDPVQVPAQERPIETEATIAPVGQPATPPAPSMPLRGAPAQPAEEPSDTQDPLPPATLPPQRAVPQGTVPLPPGIPGATFGIPTVIPSHQLLERWAPASQRAPQVGAAPSPDDEGTALPSEGTRDPDSTEIDPSKAADAPATGEPVAPNAASQESTAPTPPQPPARPETAGSEAPPPAPGPPVNRERADGEDADRESDATSRVEVPPDQWRRGRPLAAHGLEIKTRRPVFPELTRLTAAPRSPVVEIQFDHRGVPRRAGIVRTSGDARVDGPIVDSLYRWRATGAPLAKLREGETIRIEMQILLGER